MSIPIAMWWHGTLGPVHLQFKTLSCRQSSRRSRHLELKERAQLLLQKARHETALSQSLDSPGADNPPRPGTEAKSQADVSTVNRNIIRKIFIRKKESPQEALFAQRSWTSA